MNHMNIFGLMSLLLGWLYEAYSISIYGARDVDRLLFILCLPMGLRLGVIIPKPYCAYGLSRFTE